MPDLEKVVKALECCANGNQCTGKCPYDELGDTWNDCVHLLLRDARALLKEQEPLKPVLKKIRLGFHTDAVRIEPCCGGCGHKLEAWYKYCSYCGRAVKLE